MKLHEIKALRAYSETFWKHWDKRYNRPYGDNPTRHSHNQHWKGILIENHISGTWETGSGNLGQQVRRFRPYINNPIWSHWRVGIPVKYKGKRVILWARAYHCEKGEPIIWLRETIWMIDTNKEMRNSAQEQCWDYMLNMSRRKATDVSDIRLKRWVRPFQADGWLCDHNGTLWSIYPSASYKKGHDGIQPVTDEPRTYWVQHHSSGILAKHCETLKDAKIFIKNEGAIWMASRSNYDPLLTIV
jgi:hypothetical protein